MSSSNAKTKNRNNNRNNRHGREGNDDSEAMKTDHMRKFVQRNEELIGNVTMFACPNGYEPHGDAELLFGGISITNVLVKKSLYSMLRTHS